MMKGRLVLALGLLAAACSDVPAVGGGDVGSTAGVTGEGSTGAVEPGPPAVIDIGFDQLVLREGQSVVLTAVVFDPDDDMVTGELLGPGQPSSYGVLEPELSDRWRVEIGWDAVHERWPLSFSRELWLPLTVRFVDAAGHEVEAQTSLRLVCTGLRDTACDGVCVDIQTGDTPCSE
ncbi:MAG: hypothetical protein AB1Z98_14190 [Nannocystaceae bacterium]